jgi:PPOX class probable F420-dependent enzyme
MTPSLRAIMGCSASVAELPKWARALLEASRLAHLGIVDDEAGPRVLPVTYALSAGALVSAVDHKRKDARPDRLARVRWLRSRPRAALTVDHYDEDWSRLAWVQAIGEVSILDAAEAPDALAALVERYPQYRDHVPAGPVLSLAPDRFVWWRA